MRREARRELEIDVHALPELLHRAKGERGQRLAGRSAEHERGGVLAPRERLDRPERAREVLDAGGVPHATLQVSAVRQLLPGEGRPDEIDPDKRKLDHGAIFLLIAGTYTPFTTVRFDGAWAISMTTIVWALALLGAAGKLFLPGVGRRVWLVFYIALGWMVFAALEPMLEGVPLAGLILLAIGGALYTIGVPFYAWERLPFRRAIWHGFVIAAAGVHYAAVLTGVVFA